MNLGRYFALLRQSLRRHRQHFLLSSLGVTLGIATLVFFTALGAGVRTTVLEDIFVIDRLEVIDPTAGAAITAGGFFSSAGLDDHTVEELASLPGAKAAFPKMKLTFPARASGGAALLGRDLGIEFIGDGIPPELVAQDIKDPLGFADFQAPRQCTAQSDCLDSQLCGPDNLCQPKSCSPGDLFSCGDLAYCHPERKECALPIPIIASPNVLEIYNGSVHTALRGSQGIGGRLPRLTEQMLVGFEFDIIFGESFMGRAQNREIQRERARLVGFSDRAILMGATMPLGYVKRLNARFGNDSAGETYHSILVEAASNDAVAPLADTIQNELHLELSDRHQQAQRAGLLILLLTLLFNLIAGVILLISALNITHTFTMMILERRREIGLMRALGARRLHIQALILGESTVIAALSATAGLLLARAAAHLADFLLHNQVGHFPFKPDTLFSWPLWIVAAAFATALLFCWLGALLPTIRAGRIEPSQALSSS